MKETLIIYRDWWEAIRNLPPELRFKAFDSICEYAFEGKQPEDPIITAVTALMRSAIDRDKAKWEDVREKRRQAGRQGALKTNAKRWNSTAEIQSAKSANADKNQQMPTNADKTPSPEIDKDAPLKAEFEAFRNLYPGSKRGFEIEFGNFKKKYKEWRLIIPKLRPAVERLIAYHKAAQEANNQGANIFIPNYAYLQTWINNARWEEEFPEIINNSLTHNETNKADKYERRRGIDTAARSPEDYTGTL